MTICHAPPGAERCHSYSLGVSPTASCAWHCWKRHLPNSMEIGLLWAQAFQRLLGFTWPAARNSSPTAPAILAWSRNGRSLQQTVFKWWLATGATTSLAKWSANWVKALPLARSAGKAWGFHGDWPLSKFHLICYVQQVLVADLIANVECTYMGNSPWVKILSRLPVDEILWAIVSDLDLRWIGSDTGLNSGKLTVMDLTAGG